MAVAFREAAKLYKSEQTRSFVDSLTRREQEILAPIVTGKTN